jgi:DNA-binding GntR family transcriptional regulator
VFYKEERKLKVLKFVFLFLLCSVITTGCDVSDTLHRIRYGNDRVTYHERTYYNPRSVSVQDLKLNDEKLIPTGEKVIGLPVYSTQSTLDFQQKQNVVPTVLMIKESDDKFIVYELSGGP